jgi:hypothetical protein
LVDDFAGTGKTVENRLNHIINHARGKKIDVDPNVCLMFGMEKAFQYVSSILANTHFCNQIKAGMSGYFSGKDLANKILNMKRLEEEFAPVVDDRCMPSMGHGEAEALFFIKNNNAPNSNFPIFWWPQDLDSNIKCNG